MIRCPVGAQAVSNHTRFSTGKLVHGQGGQEEEADGL